MGRAAWISLLAVLAWGTAMGQEGGKEKEEKKDDKSTPSTASYDETYVTKAESGDKIPHPFSKKTTTVRLKGKKIEVPENMVLVPEGEFIMGEGNSEHKVFLDSFCIGKFEVTNAEWKAFVDATNFRPFPTHWKGGEPPEGKENHPVVYVSWEDTPKYCEWVKEGTGWEVRLPTEAEWEKAASWDPKRKQKLMHPWGDQWDVKLCNSAWMLVKLGVQPKDLEDNWIKKRTDWEKSEKGREVIASGGNTMGVGSFKRVRSPYGCWDTAGNVGEWCQDWYVKDYYLLKDAKKNPWGPSEMEAEDVEGMGKARLVRGGAWNSYSAYCRASNRLFVNPSPRFSSYGFRVALSVGPLK
ncbi:MAG: formylglycine-generating enzyme family protein [Planctomycetota bacterium]